MGLLMREALDEYAQEMQDPAAQWADFTLVNDVISHPGGEGEAADAVVAWLKAYAGIP